MELHDDVSAGAGKDDGAYKYWARTRVEEKEEHSIRLFYVAFGMYLQFLRLLLDCVKEHGTHCSK